MNIDEISFDYNFNPKKIAVVKESIVYVADNFYKDPYTIASFINDSPKLVHKREQQPSLNMVHFKDERHCLHVEQLYPLIKDLEGFTNSKFKDFGSGGTLFSNCQMWYDNEYNNFKENYWWPHLDFGWTAIIYLNDDENCGTNLYEVSDDVLEQNKTTEHGQPWRSKKLWQKLYTIPSKFNRLVLFRAKDLYHGADINSKKYSENYRINQVMFFE